MYILPEIITLNKDLVYVVSVALIIASLITFFSARLKSMHVGETPFRRPPLVSKSSEILSLTLSVHCKFAIVSSISFNNYFCVPNFLMVLYNLATYNSSMAI